MTVEDEKKWIRRELRSSMNGMSSAYMRNSGLSYGLNFGVALPDLRIIAGEHQKDRALAESLWKEDVRELKILATMLCPAETLSLKDALQWCAECPNQEIADYLCGELLHHHAEAMELMQRNLLSESPFGTYIAFMLAACLCSEGKVLSDSLVETLLSRGKTILDEGESKEQRAVLTAFKRFGRQSQVHAAKVLDSLRGYEHCGKAEQEEFFNDLKFEFDYYR